MKALVSSARIPYLYSVLHITAGIIFLATPHTNKLGNVAQKKFKNILKRDCFRVPRSLFSDGDFNDLYKIAQGFEDHVLSILADKVPVLSCYEDKPKKLRKSFTKESVRTRLDNPGG